MSLRIPLPLAAALAATGCITGVPQSMHTLAPLGPTQTLHCAADHIKTLGYTIVAGDSDIGFVRGEKYLPRSESFLIQGSGERHVLTATVRKDPSTGASLLQVTAGLTNDEQTGGPAKNGSADADKILSACGDHANAEGQSMSR